MSVTTGTGTGKIKQTKPAIPEQNAEALTLDEAAARRRREVPVTGNPMAQVTNVRADAKPRVGVFDPTGRTLGGGQLVAGYLAALLSRFADVDLIRDWAEYGIDEIASAFGLSLNEVHERRFDTDIGFGVPGHFGFLSQVSRSRKLTSPYRLFFYCGHGVPPFCHARSGFVYCHFPVEESPLLELRRNAAWTQLNSVNRWLKKQAYQLAWRHRMRGYKAVLANSSYTAGWIERRWGVEAQVVYPPVDVAIPETEKRNLIVSVGRFGGGGSHQGKGQTAQVSAFREFLSRGHRDWKLRLIGTCYRPEDHAHLAAVREAAHGLPVEFLVNAERSVVLDSVAEAKIFWHTAGLLDESGDPYRAEHFGIATVEAMRAGCVPIVIASGGQKEIIQEGVDGFLCKNLKELIEESDVVAGDESLIREISDHAKRRSMAFTGAAFNQRIMEIVSRYLDIRKG